MTQTLNDINLTDFRSKSNAYRTFRERYYSDIYTDESSSINRHSQYAFQILRYTVDPDPIPNFRPHGVDPRMDEGLHIKYADQKGKLDMDKLSTLMADMSMFHTFLYDNIAQSRLKMGFAYEGYAIPKENEPLDPPQITVQQFITEVRDMADGYRKRLDSLADAVPLSEEMREDLYVDKAIGTLKTLVTALNEFERDAKAELGAKLGAEKS